MRDKVILIDFYWTRDKDPRVPLGHASILTHLKSHGIDVSPLVFGIDDDISDPVPSVETIVEVVAEKPDSDVAIGAYVWAESFVRATLSALREQGFTGRIILGGPQVSYATSGLETCYPEADLFVRGYGEDALLKLAQGFAPEDIKGVHVAGEFDRNEQAFVDMRELESSFLTGDIDVRAQKFIRWETQRGCLYACTFCQHKEAGAKLPHRDFAWDRLGAEIDLFCEAGVEQIAILDPIFNMGKHHLAVLRAFVDREFTGELSLQCRPERLTAEFLELASQLNVKLEFGLQTIHHDESRAVRRINNMPQVEAAIDAVSAAGLHYEVSLIFGLPHQTHLSFFDSVDWCLQRGVPVIKAFPLILLRGTKLSDQRAKWGYEVSDGDMPLAIASDSFSHDDWREMARLSEALSKTEGEHPPLLQLLAQAATLEPDLLRFSPQPKRGNHG